MSTFVIQVAPETSVWKAASIMEAKGIKRLLVVDDEGYLLGIVSRADLVRAMARDDSQLRDDVVGSIAILGRRRSRASRSKLPKACSPEAERLPSGRPVRSTPRLRGGDHVRRSFEASGR